MTALLVALVLAAGAPPAPREVTVAEGIKARALAPRGIGVRVWPRPDEGWAELSRRVTGRFANAEAIRGRASAARPPRGEPVEVPVELLTPSLRKETVAALLPRDRCEGNVWVHLPAAGFPADGSYESLAAWFSAGPEGAASLEAQLRRGARPGSSEIRIPCVGLAPWLAEARGCCTTLAPEEEEDRAEVSPEAGGGDLLLAPAGDLLGSPARPAPAPAPRAPVEALREGSSAELRYERDGKGQVAVYRLKPGEAIYSAVILRYTGRVHAREVNELVPVIAERSGVRTLHDLPVGFEVRIPVEVLAPEYRPRSDPRRQDFERRREQVARFRNVDVAAGLDGVAVILDAGHGGRDRGAIADAVWESDYVYDILCRIKLRLEKTTRARVLPLVRNATLGHRARDRRRLEPLPDTEVLTHPPYRLEDPVVGVNLRWYLAASLYDRLREEGYAPGRIVFTSLHADSLHPGVRGAMVYVPGAEHTAGRHGRRGPEYDRRREPREQGSFSFSERERIEAEGLSRELAGQVLREFARRELPVHHTAPVRASVLRNGREWLPAVLRSNPVPARILLEVVNLNHQDDNRLLELPAFRQQVAEAYVTALLNYYGTGPGAALAERR